MFEFMSWQKDMSDDPSLEFEEEQEIEEIEEDKEYEEYVLENWED